MKEIKATIRPHRLDNVIQKLHELPHFPGLTHFGCHGQGRGRGAGGAFLLTEADMDSHEAVRIEIICSDDAEQALVQAIAESAHTGNPGDGIITVTDVIKTIRIRSRQTGDQAL